MSTNIIYPIAIKKKEMPEAASLHIPVVTAAAPAATSRPIIIIGSLFFIFGFVTWLNSVLIPYLKIACELNSLESYMVAFAFYIAYLVMAIPSTRILKRTGFKNGMSVGLL